MKLILTREVAGLGAAGDVVTVKDGYGRNFLLPRGNAIVWSQGGEKQIEGIRRARSAREVRDIDHAKEIKAKLEGASIVTKAKVGAKGALFGSVTDKDVALAIKAATGLDVDRHAITTKGHIKKLGNHDVKIALGHNVIAKISVAVVADK
ncbi:MAG: 50S ribosomal protein L9 [Candidatus Planktophila sp.]|nr:50S ribosomal protein L9 [Candidatus Planktophila sp.]